MSDEVSEEYRQALRRLSGAHKLRTASALYWDARLLKAARLHKLHPSWSEEQVQERVKVIFRNAVS